MAKIYSNYSLDLSTERVWTAKNGATRRELNLINKLISQEVTDCFEGSLGFLDKGNHSFIFINLPRPDDNRVLGLFLNSAQGYQIKEGKELYANSSCGGYGNSESRFGIYEVGALIEVNTYKNRQSPSYYRLTESGWQNVAMEHLYENDQQVV